MNPAAVSAELPPEIRDQALEWQVTFWSGEATERDEENFRRWLAASPEHERAWQKVRQLDRKLRAVPDAIAGRALRGSKRRKVLRALGFATAGGLAAAGMGRETVYWKQATADYRTRAGERREISLADGTRVTINTASALDLRFDASIRRLVLHAGEILIATASDLRPFIVTTAQGDVRALGTRFTVRQMPDVSHVAVFEGAVEIRPGANPDAVTRLDAGQQTQFGRTSAATPAETDAIAATWTKGLLVAERMRLGDFLAELGRYRSGIVHCDPAVAGLIVSGVYPLADTDHVLESLARALPVHVSYATRYWVNVGPR